MFNTTTDSNNEVLFISSYPPRECGLATYSKDLINVIQNKFDKSFSIKVCALEEGDEFTRAYPDEVKYVLNSKEKEEYIKLADKINGDGDIKKVFVQHEFGLFGGKYGEHLLQLIYSLNKPTSITFHTVLPGPSEDRKGIVQAIVQACEEVVVMTENSSSILQNEYDIPADKISVIPHGAHIISWRDKEKVKREYKLHNKLVLSTFGLMGRNKSIETALDALPEVVKQFPNVLYLVLGRTHPGVVQHEGESYREYLEEKVEKLNLKDNVRFVNKYLELDELLEYLRLTDIYLFTSKDPHQAVSGTFAYAMSSACPIISTPIPHAREVLKDNMGVLFDFQDSNQLSGVLSDLLVNKKLRKQMGRNAFHYTRANVWENTATSHAKLFHNYLGNDRPILTYTLPEIHMSHIQTLTDGFGMIQFSDICEPDISSGYTLDDNARALIASIMHYNLTRNEQDLKLATTYLNFIEYCQQHDGKFLNYVDKNGGFHIENGHINLEDSNGRAIWALGVLLTHHNILPDDLVNKAKRIFDKSLSIVWNLESPRAISFAIKGLYYYQQIVYSTLLMDIVDRLATKLVDRYTIVADTDWQWFEEYLTYANSVLPEAMLYAYLVTNKSSYKLIAHITFEFLLTHLFTENTIKVVSNRNWHHKGEAPNIYGEQPIDVSYTIQALEVFYQVFNNEDYLNKMEIAFSWFLGNNHLGQIIYNPLTGGCYDGLEKYNVNLNQGAESTVCYLIARLIIERNRVKNTLETDRPPLRVKDGVFRVNLPQQVTVLKSGQTLGQNVRA